MAQRVGTYPELDALDVQARELLALLEDLEPSELLRPTRCEGWNVRELIAHVAGALHVSTSLCRDETSEAPTRDRVAWYGTRDGGAAAQGIRDRSKEEAAKRSDEELLEWCRREIRDSLATFSGDPTQVVGRKGVFLRKDELAAARCVELGVHTMDLGHATLRGERLVPRTAETIVGILDELLEAPLPKQLGWDTRTYILTATGRRRMEPNERYTLGDLADRFPLIR